MKVSYQSCTDAQLAELLIQRDIRAYEEVYTRYWAPLYQFSRRILRDDFLAEDVIQDVFENLYERMTDLYEQTSIRSFLYTSVRNSTLNIIKRNKIRGDYASSFQSFVEAGSWDTDQKVRENELSRLIEKEIENLPPKMREIFELSRKHYLSYKEIAEATGSSEGTVKKQIFYAIKRLRAKLSCFVLLQLMLAILWFNRS